MKTKQTMRFTNLIFVPFALVALTGCPDSTGAADDGPPLVAPEVGEEDAGYNVLEFDTGGFDFGAPDPCETDCSELDDVCVIGTCDVETGECVADPRVDGFPCDDGDLCTVNDSCVAGVCAGAEVDCDSSDVACLTGSCDPATGECVLAPDADGASCDDANPCTENDTCDTGGCQGEPVDCSSLNSECSVGSCDPIQGCIAVPLVGTPCDDGDGCTLGDTCDMAGTCSGTAVDCAAQAGSCAVGMCDPSTGGCTITPVADGTMCDDGNVCTTGGTCTAGVCNSTPVDCSGDTCNAASCDPTTGCSLTVRVNEVCDDGDPCTASDTCSATGSCVGTTLDCAVLDTECTFGVCDAANGVCAAMSVNDGQSCDSDPDDCVVESCSTGTCAIASTSAECSPCGGGVAFCHGAECLPSLSTRRFDFENSAMPAEFTSTTWAVTSEDSVDGTRSIKSGALAASQTSSVTLEVHASSFGTIDFARKTLLDSDASMAFFIDGVEQERWSGNNSWGIEQLLLDGGRHTLRWDVQAGAAGVAGPQGGFVDLVIVRDAAEVVHDMNADLGAFTTSGDAPYAVSATGAHEGTGSAFAAPTANQTSVLSLPVSGTRDSIVGFWLSNGIAAGELFEVWVDGVKDYDIFPDPTWTYYTVLVPAGDRTLEFRFTAGAGGPPRRIGIDDVTVARDRCL